MKLDDELKEHIIKNGRSRRSKKQVKKDKDEESKIIQGHRKMMLDDSPNDPRIDF